MPNRPRRAWRVLGYLAMAVAGLAAIMWPPPSVQHAANRWLAYVWAAFLLLGGVACAVGDALDVWIGEYVGLVPLGLAWTIFGVSAAATRRPTAVAGAAALLAVALLLGARWRDVSALRREATRQVRGGR
jgi:hypothetical protein